MTLLSVHLQAPIGSFQGISQRNRGGNIEIHLRWEDLVSLASQRRFSPVCSMSGLVTSILWPSAWKYGFWSFFTFGNEFVLGSCHSQLSMPHLSLFCLDQGLYSFSKSQSLIPQSMDSREWCEDRRLRQQGTSTLGSLGYFFGVLRGVTRAGWERHWRIGRRNGACYKIMA